MQRLVGIPGLGTETCPCGVRRWLGPLVWVNEFWGADRRLGGRTVHPGVLLQGAGLEHRAGRLLWSPVAETVSLLGRADRG